VVSSGDASDLTHAQKDPQDPLLIDEIRNEGLWSVLLFWCQPASALFPICRSPYIEENDCRVDGGVIDTTNRIATTCAW